MWKEISILFGYFRKKRARKQSVKIKSGKYGAKEIISTPVCGQELQ
jgi:hypothetical protein